LEGYMDVVSLWQGGFRNAVASCGTALTPEQARMLRRLCHRVLFLYDADDAGQRAMQKGSLALMAEELQVSAVALPQGHDPDSFIREFGPEAFQSRLTAARDAFEHFLDAALTKRGSIDVAAPR
jgi:DNA primase